MFAYVNLLGVTFKRVYKFPDGTDELRAENPRYPPLRIGDTAKPGRYAYWGSRWRFNPMWCRDVV